MANKLLEGVVRVQEGSVDTPVRDTCEYRYTEREEGIEETTPSEDVADALQHRERLAGFVTSIPGIDRCLWYHDLRRYGWRVLQFDHLLSTI
jgi:hypothetical protein